MLKSLVRLVSLQGILVPCSVATIAATSVVCNYVEGLGFRHSPFVPSMAGTATFVVCASFSVWAVVQTIKVIGSPFESE